MPFDAVSGDGPGSGRELQRGSATRESASGKKFAVEVSDAKSYPLQDITAMQSVLPSFTKDIFFHPRASCIFQAGAPREIAIFKVLQNLVMGDGYKVRSLISDIDPSEVGKWMGGEASRSSVPAMQPRNIRL